MKPDFTKKLLAWNRSSNKRQMPWKGEKDPYKIWLSEVILQQTRVEQGWEYYNNFIKIFPTVRDLANAPEQQVFKLWEGLGYYTRCKNLIATAKIIVEKYNGEFPRRHEDILALKGIGPYTAAAIASFAYNLPHPVIDGNVYRVLSRYFGVTTPVDCIEGRRLFNELAEVLLDHKKPGVFNQAIMDFGAIICKPQQPLCLQCVQRKECEAYRHNAVDRLPVKEKAVKKRTRWFYYFIIEWKNKVYIHKRSEKDIWENLYEFPLVEKGSDFIADPAAFQVIAEGLTGTAVQLKHISKEYRQQLSHQTISGQFITVSIKASSPMLKGYEAVTLRNLENYPFPAFINNYLSGSLYLSEKI
jgi:A/G-specific adenine glycosylase